MLKNILLIDDDPDEAELFRDVLSDLDPSIAFDFAHSGKAAINSLAKNETNPDIIFLDINMPEMNGWECLRALKAMPVSKNIPVYMYSTSRQDRDRRVARELGAVELITKHSNYRKFKETIASIFSGGTSYFRLTGLIGANSLFNRLLRRQSLKTRCLEFLMKMSLLNLRTMY